MPNSRCRALPLQRSPRESEPDQRTKRLELGLNSWRTRFAGRIFGFGEDAALCYGEIMSAGFKAR
jgi:hypothetical protein